MEKNVCFMVATMFLAVGLVYGDIDPELKNFLAHSRQERVAVVGIGDSNQRFGGHGWSEYMADSFQQHFGAFGTGVILCANTVADQANGTKNSGAPEPLDITAFSYWYLPSGVNQKLNWDIAGLLVPANHPLNIKGNLEYQLVYGTFKESGGSIRPTVRMDKAPYTALQSLAIINTDADIVALKSATLTIDADPNRDYPLRFSPAPTPSVISGPSLLAYATVVNSEKNSGCSYQTLYAVGGHSLFDMLTNLKKRSTDGIATYFQAIRNTLNGRKSCLIMINSGLNDLHAKGKSFSPEGSDISSSPDSYRNNLLKLVRLLEGAWIKAGGAKETIFFVFMPSHPISTPDNPMLVSYRQAAAELAKMLPNAACIMLPELVSQETMDKGGYYDKASKYHLSRIGYQKISEAVVEKL